MGLRDFFSRRNRNKLDERIVEKEVERADKIEEAHAQGRYSFFENDFCKELFEKCMKVNDFDRYISFYNMVEGWDDTCNLSMETGQYVGHLWAEDIDMIPAIHRANLGIYEYEDGMPTNKNLTDIMTNGLINNGHAMLGVGMKEIPAPALTATPLDSFTGMINLLASYKNNNTTVILRFPRLLVNKELHFTSEEAPKELYDEVEGMHVIKPDYIVGAIIKSYDGYDKFYSREEILEASMKKAV